MVDVELGNLFLEFCAIDVVYQEEFNIVITTIETKSNESVLIVE